MVCPPVCLKRGPCIENVYVCAGTVCDHHWTRPRLEQDPMDPTRESEPPGSLHDHVASHLLKAPRTAATDCSGATGASSVPTPTPWRRHRNSQGFCLLKARRRLQTRHKMAAMDRCAACRIRHRPPTGRPPRPAPPSAGPKSTAQHRPVLAREFGSPVWPRDQRAHPISPSLASCRPVNK